MRFRIRLIATTLAAGAFLAITVTSTSARSLSISERNFELIWSEALGAPKTKLELIDRTAGLNVQCRLTLLGRFNERTIVKETARDQGTINHGELESCEGGTATIKTETFPWGLRYSSFTGTLPRITSITTAVINARWKVREPSGTECESGTEVVHPAKGIWGNSGEASETGLEETNHEVENVTAEKTSRIPLRGEFLCALAGEGEFGGIGLIRNLPRTAKVRITLIEESTPPTLEPSPIAFGTLEVESLARRTVTLTAGSEALTVNRISVRSGNYFAITDPNRCVGSRLEARRTCLFRVLFSAPAERREFEDRVVVETTAGSVEDRVTART